jgi:tetratricopeptide (TPR) repeat protein
MLALTFGASSLLAQVDTMTGKVLGVDGKGVRDAKIRITRQDMKGTYNTKTNKNGEWIHAGVPAGSTVRYNIEVEVDGQVVDRLQNATFRFGQPPFVADLAAVAKRQEAVKQAAATGQMTEEMTRGMSKEEREKMEAAMKEREKQLKANQELNNAFKEGRTALEAKDFPTAIAALEKAGTLDDKQVAVWGSLGDAYAGLAKTQTGAELEASRTKAIEAYQKSIAIQDDAATRNQIGLLYGEMKKFDEMKNELSKAAELDPAKAGMFYFNIGAICVNNGRNDCAREVFAKIPDTDEKYADGRYQYGILLLSEAKTRADGTIEYAPGTIEAFQAYLDRKPEGPLAHSAKDMITTLGGKIDLTYTDPTKKTSGAKSAPKPTKAKKP